ncbi:MAG: hypothetical protein OXQ89_14305 [Rhodospirillaceae bacterium]|nr:hypothetical protein [Rhodospirillaceae bacterium]MDD9998910.1 hypothetical protein [Rhodospirillaceae bacterium]
MRRYIWPFIILCLCLSACGGPGESGDGPQVASGFDAFFPKQIDVFGVSVRGTAGTPDDKMLHAANVMAEYLDNDADGVPDNALVVQAMRANNATLIMTIDFAELDDVLSEMGVDDIPEGVLQDQNAAETRPGGAANGVFDASFEEVLHLITHAGYAHAYPEAFGETPGTSLANAMDKARGGRFMQIPDPYPEGAWYSYDDQTCDYGCMAAEYIYWGLTSLLGAQEFPGRLEQIDNEWRLNTPELFEEHDPDLFALLTDPEYALPTRLPTGNYTAGELVFSGDP